MGVGIGVGVGQSDFSPTIPCQSTDQRQAEPVTVFLCSGARTPADPILKDPAFERRSHAVPR